MPRIRNGKPEDTSQAKGRKRTSARKSVSVRKTRTTKQVENASVEGSEAPPPEDPKKKQISMVERVRLAERLAVARTKPKPDTWNVIAKREGVPTRTLQYIYAGYQEEQSRLGDSTGAAVLNETLMLYATTIERLAYEADFADNSSARVGAARALLDALKGRIELMAVAGRMPRNFRAMDELALLQRLLRRMSEVVEKHDLGPEVVNDFLALADDLQPVIEGSPPRALPPGD